MSMLPPPTRATLKNGLQVVNFGSPHEFHFEDGTILDSCNNDRVGALNMKQVEHIESFPGLPGVVGVYPDYKMTPEILAELYKLQSKDDIHLILVSLPLRNWLRNHPEEYSKLSKVCGSIFRDGFSKTVLSNRFYK